MDALSFSAKRAVQRVYYSHELLRPERWALTCHWLTWQQDNSHRANSNRPALLSTASWILILQPACLPLPAFTPGWEIKPAHRPNTISFPLRLSRTLTSSRSGVRFLPCTRRRGKTLQHSGWWDTSKKSHPPEIDAGLQRVAEYKFLYNLLRLCIVCLLTPSAMGAGRSDRFFSLYVWWGGERKAWIKFSMFLQVILQVCNQGKKHAAAVRMLILN